MQRKSPTSHRVVGRGSFAFIADPEDGLQTIDISDPENPMHVDSHDTPGNA